MKSSNLTKSTSLTLIVSPTLELPLPSFEKFTFPLEFPVAATLTSIFFNFDVTM